MAVLGAIGLGYLSEEASPRLALAVVLVLVLVFPAVSITTDEAALDDPVIEGVQTRYGYTEAELAGVETIGRITSDDESEIHTDHPYGTVFERTAAHESDDATLTDGSPADETVVWRSYQGSGAAYFLDGDGRPYQPAVIRTEMCGGRDVTYSNGDVALCPTPPERSAAGAVHHRLDLPPSPGR